MLTPVSGVGVLTVHHEEEIRRAARAVVQATPGLENVANAASAEEAIELAVALRPALVLVGAAMPGIDGFETSARLLGALPDTRVVVLYSSTQPDAAALADAGATAAIHVDALTPAWLQAVWEEHKAG